MACQHPIVLIYWVVKSNNSYHKYGFIASLQYLKSQFCLSGTWHFFFSFMFSSGHHCLTEYYVFNPTRIAGSQSNPNHISRSEQNRSIPNFMFYFNRKRWNWSGVVCNLRSHKGVFLDIFLPIKNIFLQIYPQTIALC